MIGLSCSPSMRRTVLRLVPSRRATCPRVRSLPETGPRVAGSTTSVSQTALSPSLLAIFEAFPRALVASSTRRDTLRVGSGRAPRNRRDIVCHVVFVATTMGSAESPIRIPTPFGSD